jgi:LEA14-like dessication related protein
MQRASWIPPYILSAWGIILPACSLLVKRPEVTVKGVSPVSFSLSSIDLDVIVLVDNPNSFGITLKSLSFDVHYQNGDSWIYLSHGEKTGIRINAGENAIDIPVKVQNTGLIRSLAGFIASRKITLRIKGTASPDMRIIAPNVPFTYTTTISL